MEKYLDMGLEGSAVVNEAIEVNKIEEIESNIMLENLIEIELKANTTGVDLGHTFTYTIIIQNKSNEDLLDVNITQKIQKQLRLSDVVVDSVNITNIDRYNKFITFYVDEIKAKEIKIIDIVVEVIDTGDKTNFESDVKLEGLYYSGRNTEKNVVVKSKQCDIKVITPKLVLKKKSLVLEAVVGEIVTFTILAENKGNLDIDNVIIRDVLKPELMFLNDTIHVDGISKPDESILSGINIGGLKEGDFKKIVFNAQILSKPEIGMLTNVSLGQYEYSIEGDSKLREGNAVSNENKIKIQCASIKVDKKCNEKEISLGDEIIFSVDIINNGTLEIKNIVVNENIKNSLKLIDGSFTINNQIVNNINLSKGILVGDLEVGEKINITYKVKYFKSNSSMDLLNITKVNFDYKQTAGLILKGKEVVKELYINTTISNFKYIAISDKIFKEKNKVNIGSVDDVSANIDLLEYHLVKTMEGKSNEGQILTGYKVVIQGMIKEVVQYTSEGYDKYVYTLYSNIPFSTFIILPSTFKEGSKISIDYEIEDISFKKKDEDHVYTNIFLLLIAKVQPYII